MREAVPADLVSRASTLHERTVGLFVSNADRVEERPSFEFGDQRLCFFLVAGVQDTAIAILAYRAATA